MASDAQIDAMSAVPAGLPSDLLARRPDIRAARTAPGGQRQYRRGARSLLPAHLADCRHRQREPEFSGLFDGGNDAPGPSCRN
jgi:multidrug efflux system outer membrane protein